MQVIFCVVGLFILSFFYFYYLFTLIVKNFNETWTISPTVSGRGEFYKYTVKDLLICTPPNILLDGSEII